MIWYTFFISIFVFCGCSRTYNNGDSQKLVSINIIDRNGLSETISNPERLDQYSTVNFSEPQPYQKVLRIYTRDSQGNIPACITSYHSNGYVKQYLEVVNSRAYGVYQEWHSNGKQKIQAFVIEGAADLSTGTEKTWLFDGQCLAWRESGALEASIPYVKGKLDGVSIYYHKEDCIWKKIPFEQGNIHGTVEIYCLDGTLLQTISYCHGLREGPAMRYWGPDQISAEETYNEGLLVSGCYYNKDQSCISRVEEGNGIKTLFSKDCIVETHEYRYGVLEGQIKVFDRYGRVSTIYHVKNGCKQGEEICFYDALKLQPTLNPKLSINWYDGKIQGLCKSWYANGIQESQKEMSNNKKNGHTTAWYNDGSLMLIEEYEQDQLVKGEYYTRGDRFPISVVDNGTGIATLYDAEGNFKQKVEYRQRMPEGP